MTLAELLKDLLKEAATGTLSLLLTAIPISMVDRATLASLPREAAMEKTLPSTAIPISTADLAIPVAQVKILLQNHNILVPGREIIHPSVITLEVHTANTGWCPIFMVTENLLRPLLGHRVWTA